MVSIELMDIVIQAIFVPIRNYVSYGHVNQKRHDENRVAQQYAFQIAENILYGILEFTLIDLLRFASIHLFFLDSYIKCTDEQVKEDDLNDHGSVN